MGSNDYYEVSDPRPRSWRVAFRRWLARVLGVKSGLSITIPPGATLVMPPDSVVEEMVVAGGEVRYAAVDLRSDVIEGRCTITAVTGATTICEQVAEIAKQVPDEEWAKVPSDLT